MRRNRRIIRTVLAMAGTCLFLACPMSVFADEPVGSIAITYEVVETQANVVQIPIIRKQKDSSLGLLNEYQTGDFSLLLYLSGMAGTMGLGLLTADTSKGELRGENRPKKSQV